MRILVIREREIPQGRNRNWESKAIQEKPGSPRGWKKEVGSGVGGEGSTERPSLCEETRKESNEELREIIIRKGSCTALRQLGRVCTVFVKQ